MNKEILTEINRISELMLVNEQADDIIKGIARTEVANIVRNEIKTALKQAVKKEGYESVESSLKNGTRDLSKTAQIYQNIYKGLGRELTAQEKILVRTEAAKMLKNESLNILKQEKNVLTKLASKASTGVKNVVGKVKKLFGGGQKELKPTVAKTAQVESQMAKIGAKEQQELVEGVTKKGWTWSRATKWAATLGITGMALWFFFHDNDDATPPSDIPADNSNVGGGGGASGGGKYTSCPETLPIKQFCKNETIKKIQACLKMPTRYQTGNFGPITQEYLESRGQDGTTITTETIIAVCGDNNGITNSGATSGATSGDTSQTVTTPNKPDDIEQVDADDSTDLLS